MESVKIATKNSIFTKKTVPLHYIKITKGAIAQLVEHRTENPCVPGSIPGGTTLKEISQVYTCEIFVFLFVVLPLYIRKRIWNIVRCMN